jgi:AraC-like DNA-binding protein
MRPHALSKLWNRNQFQQPAFDPASQIYCPGVPAGRSLCSAGLYHAAANARQAEPSLMSDPIQRSRFSTERLAPDQRVEVWRESISTVFDITANPNGAPERFNATVVSYLIRNQVMLSHCDTRAQRFQRGPVKVARDNLDYYLIQTHLTGSQVMKFGEREVSCQPGELMVIDLAEQHDAITTDFTQLTLLLPRHLLAPLLRHPDSQEGRVLGADKGLTQLAVSHLKNLYSALGSCSDTEALQVVEPTLLLIASALNGGADTVEQGGAGISAALLTAAKQKIEQHLHEELSVEQLCVLLGHSRSTLYRLFEHLGGVRAYIQERRLRLSAILLLSDLHRSIRICDIAYRCGFASESHFSRTFRQRYGLSPRDVRSTEAVPEPRPDNSLTTEVGDRDYEHWVGHALRAAL